MTEVLSSEAIAAFTERKRAFQMVFNTPSGAAVLDHLKPFCRARDTTVVQGEVSPVFEGRRQVYLLIQDYLDLAPEDLIKRYTRPA